MLNFVFISIKTMKPRMTRLCIYPKDIQRITGKSERYSRALLQKIKRSLNKSDHQLLSLEEFSTYIGLPLESIRAFITD